VPQDLSANVDRFTGFADCYDSFRPSPPTTAIDILTLLAKAPQPRLVVDLGCGTGLSTLIWADLALEVVGVEPSADMRGQAEARAAAANWTAKVSFREGLSTETGLPDACADIVTASQALHWMEPDGTFAEAQRILREGGVFAALDCDWPPVVGWEAEAAYLEFSRTTHALEEQRGVADTIKRWAKDKHLERIKQSGRFRYVREILVHSQEMGNAERLVGLAMSQGSVQDLLKLGLSEQEVGLAKLRENADKLLGAEPRPWYFSYRMRIGVK
jgi:ubiquinone/menaquinone biosynthesis C-methylase UbiE